ncbi:MAG TPA: gamma-glutamyl-gamma-aminobutyrate hydrolase family protein [Gemmatimonadaceae bacterium]|nr:gamma-glutamyl-gamma-aminobutyrate hydrolase family protein [Gemmatimonadaceae bacterium]
MSKSTRVAVTGTTEIIRGAPRVRVNLAYTEALTKIGLVPLVVPPLMATTASAILDGVDGLLVTGGEDVAPARYSEEPHPTVEIHEGRDESEIALILEARRRRMPTLAICRGIQVVNVAFGGSLVQDIPSQRQTAIDHDPDGRRDERVHEVRVETPSNLAKALGTDCLTTNSFHHQALARIAKELRVTARASDGIIEGAESSDPSWWMLAVQWHPEELTETPEPWDRNLFAAFARAVGRES